MQEEVAVTIVIPVRDEIENVAPLIERLAPLRERVGRPLEAVFVDDGSRDGTAAAVEAARAADRPWVRLVELRRPSGKAAALAAGFAHARGATIVTLDGDLQDAPEDIPLLLEKLAGADVVCGWRVERQDPLGKRLASSVYNALLRRLSGLGLHDVNCGLKALTREAALALDLYGDLHRLIPLLAAGQGFRVDEAPVGHGPRRHGRTKYGAGRFQRGLIDILTVLFLLRFDRRPGHFFGPLGLGLGAAGGAILAWLAFLRLTRGTIEWRYPLLALGVLLVVVGIQVLTTGLLAELLVLATRVRPGGPGGAGERYAVRRVVG